MSFLLNPSQGNKTELLNRLDTLDSYSADRLLTFVQTLIKINERVKLVRYTSPRQKKRKGGLTMIDTVTLRLKESEFKILDHKRFSPNSEGLLFHPTPEWEVEHI